MLSEKMSENKTVFVDEKLFEKLVKKLGYTPSNLVINKFLPENIGALVVDNKEIK